MSLTLIATNEGPDRAYSFGTHAFNWLSVWIVPKENDMDYDGLGPTDPDEATKLRISLEDAAMGPRLLKAVSAALGDVYAKRGCMSNGEGVFGKIEVAA